LAAAPKQAGLEDFFAGGTGAHQREYLKWIGEAKRPAARAARIGQAMEMLGKKTRRRRRAGGQRIDGELGWVANARSPVLRPFSKINRLTDHQSNRMGGRAGRRYSRLAIGATGPAMRTGIPSVEIWGCV
jgi:hypothetical protein